MEEIIDYNKEEKKIISLISIVECAKSDLKFISHIWKNEEDSA